MADAKSIPSYSSDLHTDIQSENGHTNGRDARDVLSQSPNTTSTETLGTSTGVEEHGEWRPVAKLKALTNSW